MPSPNLAEFVQQAQLKRVRFTELSAVRLPNRSSGEPSDTPEVEAEDVGRPQFELNIQTSSETETFSGFELNLRLVIEMLEAHVAVAASANYEVPEGHKRPSLRLLNEYANEVGVMTLLPFIRQGLADLSLRVLESPILMPVMQRGQVSFPMPPDPLDLEDPEQAE